MKLACNFSRQLKKQKGVSLLLGLGFSVALLSAASLISSAMLYAQKNTRNIEDVNIAFFAAEAGIEEALYYNSFHKKGFEFDEPELQIGAGIIPNTFYDWNIEGQITEARCNADPQKCIGSISFGNSTTLNFSYDENTKNTTNVGSENNDNAANLTKIEFAIHEDFSGNIENNDDKVTGTWIASYLDVANTEQKLLYQHDGIPPLGNDPNDCSPSLNSDGKLICIKSIKGSKFDGLNNFTDALSFNVNTSAVSGCLTTDCSDPSDPQSLYTNGTGFFQDAGQSWRKLKFFYVNLIQGSFVTDPAVDKLYYKVSPASGETMTALKTIISSQGRSRNILSNLEVKVDNTQELTALDYGILFE